MSFVYLVFGSRCVIILRVHSLNMLKLGNMQLMLGFKELSINLLGELALLSIVSGKHFALLSALLIYLHFRVGLELGNQE